MVRLALALVLSILVVSPVGQAFAADEDPPCNIPEIVNWPKKFNTLICNAEANLESHNYAKALELLEEARKIHLFEYPNVRLFPAIARAKFGLGDVEGAKRDLKKAEVVLSVKTGIAGCAGWEFEAQIEGYSLEKYDLELVQEVAEMLCWPGYGNFFTRKFGTIEIIEYEHRLLMRIREARSIIEATP